MHPLRHPADCSPPPRPAPPSPKLNRRSRRRPGILVLINDADWELEGEDEYVLQAGDTVLFVSTLHGG